MHIPRHQITGLILAGGLGTRMGGVDKGLQALNGEPMVSRILHRLQPQVGTLMINANRHLDDYRAFGVPVITDCIGGQAGPLAGLHAGLAACNTDWLLTVPCDAPCFPQDLVERLSAGAADANAEAAIAITGSGAEQQRHPVFCLLRQSTLPALDRWLTNGGRKVDAWLATLRCASVHFDDAAAFVNLNTRAELDALAARR